jgi:hypothetical protein
MSTHEEVVRVVRAQIVALEEQQSAFISPGHRGNAALAWAGSVIAKLI